MAYEIGYAKSWLWREARDRHLNENKALTLPVHVLLHTDGIYLYWNIIYAKQMRAEILIRQSQREQQDPFILPSHQLPPPVNISSSSSSFSSPSSSSSPSPSPAEPSHKIGDVDDPKRPRRNPQNSLQAANNSQQQRDGLLETSRKGKEKAKEPKRRKPGKKALQAARGMSQFLDNYQTLPSKYCVIK